MTLVRDDAGALPMRLRGDHRSGAIMPSPVALRTPFDLAAYREAPTHMCTYGILPPSLDAVADALFGVVRPVGRLPVPIAGLYPLGHALEPAWA